MGCRQKDVIKVAVHVIAVTHNIRTLLLISEGWSVQLFIAKM
jgi:hypothetical protein